jgi:hypothetical protein
MKTHKDGDELRGPQDKELFLGSCSSSSEHQVALVRVLFLSGVGNILEAG